MMSETNRAQLALIREITERCDAVGMKMWLLGGWGIDALCGEIRRDHHDIDLIIRLEWRDSFRRVVEDVADKIADDTAQKLRFVKDGIQCDTRFFQTTSDGMLVSDLDASDLLVYPWPPDSFPDNINGFLDCVRCRAISWSAQFVVKEGYKDFKPDSTFREKDNIDLVTIKEHIRPSEREKLRTFFPGIPKEGATQPGAPADADKPRR